MTEAPNQSQNLKRHFIGIFICAVLVAALQYLAAVWSLADFHPGIADVSENQHRTARLGNAMLRPFVTPLFWLASITGGYSTFSGIAQWLILPLCYGAVLYAAFTLLYRITFART